MKHAARIIIFFMVLAAASASPAADERPISITTRTATGFEPLSATIHVRVPHHPDNRMVCLVYDSVSGSSGESCWSHGPDDFLVRDVVLKNLSGGNYEVAAYLFRAGKKGALRFDAPHLTIRVISARESAGASPRPAPAG